MCECCGCMSLPVCVISAADRNISEFFMLGSGSFFATSVQILVVGFVSCCLQQTDNGCKVQH